MHFLLQPQSLIAGAEVMVQGCRHQAAVKVVVTLTHQLIRFLPDVSHLPRELYSSVRIKHQMFVKDGEGAA